MKFSFTIRRKKNLTYLEFQDEKLQKIALFMKLIEHFQRLYSKHYNNE